MKKITTLFFILTILVFSFSSSYAALTGDMDGDGKITILDVRLLLQGYINQSEDMVPSEKDGIYAVLSEVEVYEEDDIIVKIKLASRDDVDGTWYEFVDDYDRADFSNSHLEGTEFQDNGVFVYVEFNNSGKIKTIKTINKTDINCFDNYNAINIEHVYFHDNCFDDKYKITDDTIVYNIIESENGVALEIGYGVDYVLHTPYGIALYDRTKKDSDGKREVEYYLTKSVGLITDYTLEMGIVDEVNFESGSPSICIEGEWYYVCYYHHHSIVFDDDELSELIGQTIMYTFDCNGNVVIVKKIELKDFTNVSRVTGVNWIQVDFEGGPLDGTVNIFSDSVNNEFHDYTTFFVDVEDSNGELSIIGGRRAGTRGDGLIAEVEFVPESAGYVRGEVYEINQFVAIDAKTKSIYRIWYDGSPEVFMAEVEALEGDPGSSTSKFVVRFLIDDKVYRHVAVKKGDTVDKPDDPQLNVFGATFEGWHLQDSWDEYDFSQPITHNMKLYGSFAFSEFLNSIYNSCVLNVTSGDTNVMISNELIEVDFEDERSIVKNKEELYGLNGACIVYEDPNWSDREKLLIISKIDSNDINSAMNVYDIMESNIYKDSSRRNLLPIVYMNDINGETVIFDPAGEYYQKYYTIVQANGIEIPHGTQDVEPGCKYEFYDSQCDGTIGLIYARFNIGSRVIIDEANEIIYIIDEAEKPDPSGEDELGENSGDPYVEPSYPDEDESGEPYLKPGENSGDPYVELNSSGDCVLPELANTAYNAFLLKQYENDYVELDNNWFEVDFDNNPVISNSSEFLPLSLYSPCIVYDEAYLMSDNKVRFVDSLSFNEMNDGIIVNRINTLSNGSQEVIAYSMAGTMRKLFW